MRGGKKKSGEGWGRGGGPLGQSDGWRKGRGGHETVELECCFSNAMGREQVSFLYRYIYNRTEIACFDSTQGWYGALTVLGEPDAQYWNSRKEVLTDKRSEVDTFCRHNYGVAATGRMVGRKGEFVGVIQLVFLQVAP
uniref:MHC class II beta chain N-terminal domain-containing protein n=1 Tax=Varanus komodoensis TaxID=61221 RepID=A0A8D2L7W3_VARKO